MNRIEHERWQRLHGLDDKEAAAVMGMSVNSYRSMADGFKTTPRYINYFMAWSYLYGLKKPYENDALAQCARTTARMLSLTNEGMAATIGVATNTLFETWEADDSWPPTVGAAFAWIRMYGSRLPFPDARLAGYKPCPKCGR